MAVHVEDHPVACADFEGTIPRDGERQEAWLLMKERDRHAPAPISMSSAPSPTAC